MSRSAEMASFSVATYTSVRSVLMSSDGKLLYAGATDEFGYFQMSGQSKQLVYTSLSAQLPSPFKSGEQSLFKIL